MLDAHLRKYVVTSIAVVFVGSFLAVSDARVNVKDFCKEQGIPLTHGFTYPSIGLKVLSHDISIDKCAVGRLQLMNESDDYLRSVTMVIEYLDTQGDHMFSIPFYAGVKGVKNEIKIVRPFYERELDHPVEPGGVFWIEGTNLLQVNSFPVKGRISAIHAVFAKGSIHNSHGFKSDPVLEATPAHVLLSAEDDLPDEVWVSLQVDTKGRVVKVTEEQPSTSSVSSLLEQLGNEIRKWHFFPGIDKAFATDSKLPVLIRFHRRGWLPTRECMRDRKRADKYAVVDLERTGSNLWAIRYGFYSVAGEFPRQILVEVRSVD